MAWKCDKCGMPNFSDDNCKLCGAPKPENPEEFIEETTTPDAENVVIPESEEIVFDSHPDADETIPQPEPVAAEETMSAQEEPAPEEPAAMQEELAAEETVAVQEEPEPEETVAVQEEPEPEEPAAMQEELAAEETVSVLQEPELEQPVAEKVSERNSEGVSADEDTEATVDSPATADAVVSETVNGKKKPVLAVIICLIILLLLCAVGMYMRVAKDTATSGSAPSSNPIAEDADITIPSEAPSEEPVDTPAEESANPSSDAILDADSDVNHETDAAAIPAKPVETLEPAATPKSVVTPKPASTPKPVTTPKPVATQKPAQMSWNDSYKKFVSDDFGFYCAYPAEFTLQENHADGVLLTAVSPDETAVMTILGSKNWNKLSSEEALNRFISMFSGEVRYRDYGNTWYAASVKVGDRVHYRKAFVRSGNIYCFDFEYNYKDSKTYSPYIEYIEDHFKRN